MKVTNTLSLVYERWDDPGDYPSGAGAGPLPSQTYVVGATGKYTVELKLPTSPNERFTDPAPLLEDVIADALSVLGNNLLPIETVVEIKHILLPENGRYHPYVARISVAFNDVYDDGHEPDEPFYTKEGE